MKKTVVVTILAAALAIPAFACDGHGKWMSKLDLTTEQKAQIKEIRQSKKEKFKANKEQRKAFHERKMALMDNYSDSAAEALAEEVAQSKKARMLERLKSQQKIMAILTPEQKETFKAMMAKHGERKGHYKKKRHDEWMDE